MNEGNARSFQVAEVPLDETEGFLPGDNNGRRMYQFDLSAENIDMPIKVVGHRLVVGNQRTQFKAVREMTSAQSKASKRSVQPPPTQVRRGPRIFRRAITQ